MWGTHSRELDHPTLKPEFSAVPLECINWYGILDFCVGSSTEFRKKKTRPDRLSGGSPGRFHRGHHLLDPKDKTRIKKIYQMITILWLIVILASGGRSTVELKYPKFHSMNDNPGLLPLKLGNAQN
ncbi:unnamed protein product, partial [Callosobruchus maculatus]